MNKIISYIGFAIKSNKLLSGQSLLKRTTKKLNLVLVCSSASQNLKDLALNIAKKNQCEVIITKPLLEDLTHIKNVKIVAILDEFLSKAIIENKEKIKIG